MKTGNFYPLSKKKDMLFLNKTAQFAKSSGFSIKFVFASDNTNKIAFAIRKKFGNAPQRNSIKRKIRVVVQKYLPKYPVHMLVIAKPNAMSYSFAQLKSEIDAMFYKIQNAS